MWPGFGATHIVAERDEAGSARIRDLTDGIGAGCAHECVGTEGARLQAVGSVRDGGNVGLVGVPHAELPVDPLFAAMDERRALKSLLWP